MKIRYGNERRAISPIIATVLIIAVTLIAAVAIGGFVFGLFGASSVTAQVSAVNSSMSHTLASTALAASCNSAAGAGSFIQFSNSGTANTVINTLSLTWGGNTYSATPGAGTGCTVTAGSSTYLQVTALGAAGSLAGQQYSGFIVTSNGAQVVFTGAFT